ncbi:MAG: heme-binding protein [Pseudonocardiaceae bacterium]
MSNATAIPDDGRLQRFHNTERAIRRIARPGDDLGPLKDLPGKWESKGHGWNMIALPFARTGPGALDYRLLLNQYDETLNFTLVDTKVPNRGVDNTHNLQTDQFVVTLDYEQVIHQVAVTDRPPSKVAGSLGLAIHHEPGLFLNMVNLTTDGMDVARLASIPHGSSALALGTHSQVNGVAQIPPVNGLPIGVNQNLTSPYLEPYQHFHTTPFVGMVNAPGFPGFDPTSPHLLLTLANQGVNVQGTTVLELDTTTDSGGINDIPFIEKQADATAMKSTFWIQKLGGDSPTFRLQYLQIVNLEFFPRKDGLPGRIIWPHVSINTLDKVLDTPDTVTAR